MHWPSWMSGHLWTFVVMMTMTMYDTTSTLMNENGDETTTQQGVQQSQPTITLQQLISPHGSGQ